MSLLEAFFEDLDARWVAGGSEPLRPRIIGSAALMLLERFRSAVNSFAMDARAPDLPKYLLNLNRVERDLMGAAETEIDLPEWI